MSEKNLPKGAEIEGVTVEDTSEVAVSNNQNNSKGATPIIIRIMNVIIETVGSMVRSGDQKAVKAAMREILTTVFAMCSLGEYELGLRVDGTLYRYDDYQVPAALRDLLVARKVVVRDVLTAKDFLDRSVYGRGLDTNLLLSPARFAVAWKKVCVGLRINPEAAVLSRKSVALLADVTKYAVTSGKVPEGDIPTVYFLTQKFDDEANYDLEEWARSFAIKLAG